MRAERAEKCFTRFPGSLFGDLSRGREVIRAEGEMRRRAAEAHRALGGSVALRLATDILATSSAGAALRERRRWSGALDYTGCAASVPASAIHASTCASVGA